MKVLIVVDMQNDFIDGSLGTKEAVEIVDNVVRKIQDYDKEGNEILITYDTHYDNYLETKEGKFLPVRHCIKGEHGWELNERIRDAINNLSIIINNKYKYYKKTFGSVDMAEDLKDYLEYKEKYSNETFDSIELVGLCTDICVVSNALILKAFMPEVDIIVDASCCAGVTPESHKHAIETMKMCQIIVKGE